MGGHDRILAYCNGLLEQATLMLETAWQTKRLAISTDLEAPFMKSIKLPYLKDYHLGTSEPVDQLIWRLMYDLMIKYDLVAIPIVIEDELYFRLSCFVYNTIDDFRKLRDAILELASGTSVNVNNREDMGFEII